MKKWLAGFVMGAIVAWTLPAVAGNFNIQGQHQDQDQYQDQYQGQESVGQVDVNSGEDENVYRGAFAHSVPEGNEGPAIFTPWGGVGVSKPARIYQLMAYGDYVEAGSADHKWLMAELRNEIGETCRWLGMGPKGWKFPFLLGLDCWPDLRVWED